MVMVVNTVGWPCVDAQSKLTDLGFVLAWFQNGEPISGPSGAGCQITDQAPKDGDIDVGSLVRLAIAGTLPPG